MASDSLKTGTEPITFIMTRGNTLLVTRLHEGPHLLPFGSHRLAPGRSKGLSGYLKLDFRARSDIEIPGRMFIGAALGAADHDFAAYVAIAEGRDVNLPAIAALVLDQTMRREWVSADSRDVHNVAFGAPPI